MTSTQRQRSTAGERRDTVLRTAIRGFAARGYYGTSTTDVAKGAGISQGYLYRLFPDKEALFIAVIEHCSLRLCETVSKATAQMTSTGPEALLAQLSSSYLDLIADRDLLMFLAQANCAAGEPAIGEAIRACYAQQVEHIRTVSGASDEQLRKYFADAALANLVLAIDAGSVDAPWARALRP